jgi:hypothetical protein
LEAKAIESRYAVNLKAAAEHKHFKPALCGVVTALIGLMLWGMPLGERWVNASYDYLFRFLAPGQ